LIAKIGVVIFNWVVASAFRKQMLSFDKGEFDMFSFSLVWRQTRN